MQVLVHVAVFECIVGSFLGGVDRGVEMLQLGSKAHADFKWIRHITKFFIDESRWPPRRTEGEYTIMTGV